jgi:hypothetical protein
MKELYRFRQYLTEGVIKENEQPYTDESKKNLIELIEKYSHNIPLYINNRKVWIHFTESDKIFMECDISDGSGVELNIEEI